MPPRRLLEQLLDTGLSGEAAPAGRLSSVSEDALRPLLMRSLDAGFGDTLDADGLAALYSALDGAGEAGLALPAGDEAALCRAIYDRYTAASPESAIPYLRFRGCLRRFVEALGGALEEACEPRLPDLPSRGFGELSVDELSRLEVPEALSGYIVRLARHFEELGTLSAEEADHLAGLVEKMASAPGYLRFLGEERKREEVARLSCTAMAVRSSGVVPGPAIHDMLASLGLLLYNIAPSERAASFLAGVRPSARSRALRYHYSAILALSHLLTGRLGPASSYAAAALRCAARPGAKAYVEILQGCIAIRQGDYEQALALLRKAGARAPAGRTRALAAFYCGIVLFEKQDYAGALGCFEEAGAHVIDPLDLATVNNNIGSCAMHLGDLPAAERVVARMEELSSRLKGDHARRCMLAAHSYRGSICCARGDYGQAVERYRQALELALGAHDGEAVANQLGNMGIAHARAGDREKALQLLNACMERSERAGYWAGIRFAYWHTYRLLRDGGSRSEASLFSEAYASRYPELKDLR